MMSARGPVVQVRCRALFRRPGRIALVRRAARAAIAQTGLSEPVALSISLSDDASLRRLNRQFRGIDAPTDVLSFGGEGFHEGRRRSSLSQACAYLDEGALYLGDIVISMEWCIEQAARAGHDPDAELALLVVHGVLHLLGYDHDTPIRKKRMWRVQSDALATLGLTVTPLEA